MSKTSNKYRTLCIYLALALTTLAAYWHLRSCQFVNYDDKQYVAENRHVKAGLTCKSVVWAFTTGHASNWHPLTWLSHMLDCHLFGTNPRWHHFTNLLLHIANTLLLFTVFKQMTAALWRSAFVAAAFALHPLHVESVAWIAERKDVLSTLFWMLTMIAYVSYVRRPGISRYLLTVVVFALGLMAKPMLVTLPFVLLLLDYWPLERLQLCRDANHRLWFQLVREKVPFFVLSAASSVITFLVQQSGAAVATIEKVPISFRITNALVSYVSYIVKTVYPSRLAVLYPLSGHDLLMAKSVLSFIVLVSVSAGIIRLARRRQYLAVGWLWYLGTLLPVIGLIQVGEQAFADRYTYIPLIGLFIVISWGGFDLLAKWQYRKITLALSAGIVLVVLLICTRIQVRYWQNSFTLFGHALDVTENNSGMHRAMGLSLVSQRRFDEAVSHCRQAVQINPNSARLHKSLGVALAAQGKFEEAISSYRQALQLKPNYAEVYNYLGDALQSQGWLDEAVSAYRQALQFKPNYVEAHNNLSVALQLKGRSNEAITHLRQALEAEPYYAEAYCNLGVVLQSQGKLDEAVSCYRRAVQLKPGFAEAHYNLARVLANENKINEAVTHLKETLRRRPDWLGPMNNLAWFLATHKDSEFYDPQEAIRLAQRACKLTEYNQPNLLDTLAAAYAAAGRFPEAVATAERALALARPSQQKEMIEQIQSHVDLYKSSRPYIEKLSDRSKSAP